MQQAITEVAKSIYQTATANANKHSPREADSLHLVSKLPAFS
jgi:hypothetical protein